MEDLESLIQALPHNGKHLLAGLLQLWLPVSGPNDDNHCCVDVPNAEEGKSWRARADHEPAR